MTSDELRGIAQDWDEIDCLRARIWELESEVERWKRAAVELKTAEQFAREFACTLTLRPSYAELHKMAQYASEMHEPLQEFILGAMEMRYAEIDKFRAQTEELVKAMNAPIDAAMEAK